MVPRGYFGKIARAAERIDDGLRDFWPLGFVENEIEIQWDTAFSGDSPNLAGEPGMILLFTTPALG